MWYPTCHKVGFKFQYKSKANFVYFSHLNMAKMIGKTIAKSFYQSILKTNVQNCPKNDTKSDQIT